VLKNFAISISCNQFFKSYPKVVLLCPALGLISWVFGFYRRLQRYREKQDLQNHINIALTQITQRVDEKLAKMKDCVNSTTKVLETGLIRNEFEQTYSLLAEYEE